MELFICAFELALGLVCAILIYRLVIAICKYCFFKVVTKRIQDLIEFHKVAMIDMEKNRAERFNDFFKSTMNDIDWDDE